MALSSDCKISPVPEQVSPLVASNKKCSMCTSPVDASFFCPACNLNLCFEHFEAHDHSHISPLVANNKKPEEPQCSRCRVEFMCHTCNKVYLCNDHLGEHSPSHHVGSVDKNTQIHCSLCPTHANSGDFVCHTCKTRLCLFHLEQHDNSHNMELLNQPDVVEQDRHCKNIIVSCCDNCSGVLSPGERCRGCHPPVPEKIEEVRRCSVHNKRLHMFCVECSLRICTVCASGDNGHRKHRVICAQEALTEVRPRVQTLNDAASRLTPLLETRVAACREKQKLIMERELKTRKQAEATRDELKALIDNACKRIEDKIETYHADLLHKCAPTLFEITASELKRIPELDDVATLDKIAPLAAALDRAEEAVATTHAELVFSEWTSLSFGVAAACLQWVDSYQPFVDNCKPGTVRDVCDVKFSKLVVDKLGSDARLFHVDAKNQLIVPLTVSHCVKVFDRAGMCVRTVGAGVLSAPYDAVVDSRGFMFVSDEGLHCVMVFRPDGGLDHAIGLGALQNAGGLALSLDETVLYVTAYDAGAVNAYKSGDLQWSCSIRGALSVAVLSSGCIAVVSISLRGVFVISSDGKIIRTFGCNILKCPRGVAVDAQDRLFVADSELDQVFVFASEDGKLLGQFGGKSPGARPLKSPYGVAIDHDGKILVSEYQDEQIKEFC